jgi:DNA repair exonuclease SbcCD nuclease subunit
LVRFLHSGDWQLGMTRRYLGDEARGRFADARIDAIRRLAALARDTNCAFAVVCGDVFESNHVDRRTLARSLDALADFPVPVFLLPGNHDPLDGASLFRHPAFTERVPRNVRVIEDGRPIEVDATTEIVGAPWRSKRPGGDLVAEMCDGLTPAVGVTRIGIAHGAVDVLSPDRDDPARISLAGVERALADGRIHYLALGDRHSLTSVGETGRVWYAGAPEPTDWSEVNPGQALVVDVSADAVETHAHEVGTWHFEGREGFPLDGPDDLDALEQWLEARPDKARTLLRLGFTGTLDLAGAARFERILEAAGDLFAAIVQRPGDLAVIPDDADFEDLGLSGFAAETVECLRARVGEGGQEATAARDALALLVRLAGDTTRDAGAAR